MNSISAGGEPTLLPGPCSPPGVSAAPLAAATGAAGPVHLPAGGRGAADAHGEEDGLWFY